MPSVGMMIGGQGDHYGGYIALGRNAWGPRAYGALYYDNNRHCRRRVRPYGCNGYYFRGYRPIHYVGWNYYEPWYGYSYASAYTGYPYVHPFYDTYIYDTDIYYVTQPDSVVYDTGAGGAGEQPARVESPEGPPVEGTTYPVLTQPDDSTLIGRGNAAFLAGQYDEARRVYSTAMLADERDGYAKFLYALANFAMEDYEVAGLAIRRSLMTTSDLMDYPVDVRTLYGDAATFRGQVGRLIDFVGANPQQNDARLLLAYLYYASGEPGPAAAFLAELATAAPDDEVVAQLRRAVDRVVGSSAPL